MIDWLCFQHHLGALLLQGRNGITRNVQAAVEYFRLGAAQHDASSHFGYGLALLKVRTRKKNDNKTLYNSMFIFFRDKEQNKISRKLFNILKKRSNMVY